MKNCGKNISNYSVKVYENSYFKIWSHGYHHRRKGSEGHEVDEYQGILEAHEQRLNKTTAKSDKTNDVSLLSQSRTIGSMNRKGKGKWKGDFSKKQRCKHGENLSLSNIHPISEVKVSVQGVAHMQEEEEKKRQT